MATTIDIHGYNGSSKSNWHPRLKELLTESGETVIAPDFPGGRSPVYTDWEPLIANAVEQSDELITVIGHSLGTRALLRFLEEHDIQVDRGVLVGPFANWTSNASFREGAYANFFDRELDISKVRAMAKEWIVIGSLDDSRIPFEQSEVIASELGARLVAVPDSDHFLDEKWADLIVEELE